MALIDTLEALAASISRGEISIQFAAYVVKARSIRQFLQMCDYFSLDIIQRERINGRIDQLEREYSGWEMYA